MEHGNGNESVELSTVSRGCGNRDTKFIMELLVIWDNCILVSPEFSPEVSLWLLADVVFATCSSAVLLRGSVMRRPPMRTQNWNRAWDPDRVCTYLTVCTDHFLRVTKLEDVG